MWREWLTAILGVWIVALAFLGFTAGALTWTLVVTGIIVALLGFWSASQRQTETTRRWQRQA